jgi:uncharacterized protein YdeI (YjbR/CyaY-like superfamily)
MTAALSITHLDFPRTPVAPVLAIPAELAALFAESEKVERSFWRLNDRDRRGFVRYVVEAKTDATRERRAAIVAMSLIGLAH